MAGTCFSVISKDKQLDVDTILNTKAGQPPVHSSRHFGHSRGQNQHRSALRFGILSRFADLEFKEGDDQVEILEGALAGRFGTGGGLQDHKLAVGQSNTVTARKGCPSCRFTLAIIES